MDDLISRSAVIDRIAEFLGPKGLDEWEVMVAIREIIENAPTLDVVPVVHAKWFYDDEDDRKNVECSHCHMRWAVVSDDPDSDYLVLHMTANELLFCPSCGAKMDEEEI